MGPGHSDGVHRHWWARRLQQIATPWPQLHSALLRDPGDSLFVRPPSGLPEEKQHFHLSESTYPFIYVPGTRERSRKPQSQQLGALLEELTVQSEGNRGTRVPCSPFASPVPQENRVQCGYSMVFTHSFIPQILPCQAFESARVRKRRHSSSLQGAPNLAGRPRVRSAGMETGPARTHSPAGRRAPGASGSALGPGVLEIKPRLPSRVRGRAELTGTAPCLGASQGGQREAAEAANRLVGKSLRTEGSGKDHLFKGTHLASQARGRWKRGSRTLTVFSGTE